jgi:hypothetical protein
MKRAWITVLVVGLGVCLGIGSQAAAAEKIFLTLASGSPGGSIIRSEAQCPS